MEFGFLLFQTIVYLEASDPEQILCILVPSPFQDTGFTKTKL
jgi:hypothetical protein